jgi:hypothetical protein
VRRKTPGQQDVVETPGEWTSKEFELNREDVDLLIDALLCFRAERKVIRPLQAAKAEALRKMLLLESVDWAEVSLWSLVRADLPPEST